MGECPKRGASQDRFLEGVALLISLGHSCVWNYGYTFFKAALKSVSKLNKLMALATLTGVSLAFSSKEQIKDFIKRMEE